MENPENYKRGINELRSWRGFSRAVTVLKGNDGKNYVRKERKNMLGQICLMLLEMLGAVFSFDIVSPRYVSSLQAKNNEKNRMELEIPTPAIHPTQGDFIVEDFVEGQPLDVYLLKCDESEIRTIGYEMGRRVAQIHIRKFAFGDFKASNVIVSGDNKFFHIDFERLQRYPVRFQKNLDVATHMGSLTYLPGRVYKPYYDSFLFGFTSNGGTFTWRTLLLINLCSLFIHQRLLLHNIVPNILRLVPLKYLSKRGRVQKMPL